YVGAVPVVVLPRPLAASRVAVRADAAHVPDDLVGEVLVVEVDAGVDHRDRDPLAAGPLPGRVDPDPVERPLQALGPDRIVPALGASRSSAGGQTDERDEREQRDGTPE